MCEGMKSVKGFFVIVGFGLLLGVLSLRLRFGFLFGGKSSLFVDKFEIYLAWRGYLG